MTAQERAQVLVQALVPVAVQEMALVQEQVAVQETALVCLQD